MLNDRRSRRALLGQAMAAAGVLAAESCAAEQAAAVQLETRRKVIGRINQSVSKWCYDGKLSYDDLCRHAARIGYKGIDLIGPEDWPTARKHGLVPSMSWGAGKIPKGFNRREHHAELIAEMKKNLDLAAEAGVPNVVCFSGNREGQADEEGIRNCVEGLKQVVGYAEQKKVNLCIE